MTYRIIILLLLATLKSFGQENSIKEDSPPQLTTIRLRPPINKVDEPLFIIDGKLIDESEFKKINPETIASITILKDTITTFCSGRKNVILIKTKKFTKKELRKIKKN
jgi:hypothetical protein